MSGARMGTPGQRAIYFDISDLLRYVAAHAAVSGIQRVQLRILGECAKDPRARHMHCIVRHGQHRSLEICALRDLITGDTDEDLHRLLALAGGTHRWPVPPRPLVRRYLNEKGSAGLGRALRKAGVYVRAALVPWSLPQSMNPSQARPASARSSLDPLPHDAVLVMLGLSWTHGHAFLAANAHRSRGGEVVALMYDILPVVHPEWFEHKVARAFGESLLGVLDIASRMVCISKCTERQVREYLCSAGRSIPTHVVPLAHEYHGYPRNSPDTVRPRSRLGVPGDPQAHYVLCVGTIEVRKNGAALLDAWLKLRDTLGDSAPHLVMCGRRGWKIASFLDTLASSPWLQARVHVLSGTDDRGLADLYRRSLCTVYPSLGEGWGLPIGEAAWFGRVCITSPVSSMPEVLGDLAEYVDPADPEAIAASIRRAVIDPEWLVVREQRLSDAVLRTWRDVANDFIGALEVSKSAAG